LQNRFTVKRLCKPFYVCKSLADAIGNAVFSGLKFIFNPSNSHFDVKRVSNPLYIKREIPAVSTDNVQRRFSK